MRSSSVSPLSLLSFALCWSLALVTKTALADPTAEAQAVFDFWTEERVAQAVPPERVAPAGFDRRALLRGAPTIDEEEEHKRHLQIAEAFWTSGQGKVATAAGRLLYKMGSGYFVCSGTAVTDETSGRSIILTAAHCVYDESGNGFATNVEFIPSQHESTRGTDFNCGNDPIGCWAIDFGVVDRRWAEGTWFSNAKYDYAYYVVSDTGKHKGAASSSDALDQAVSPIDITFEQPTCSPAMLIGYSYNEDPNLEYCSQPLVTSPGNYFLFYNCLLSGGSSGGPSMCSDSNGDGPLISVVSFGGGTTMGGPLLFGNSAQCLFEVAKNAPLNGGGVIVDAAVECAPTPSPTRSPTRSPTPAPTPLPECIKQISGMDLTVDTFIRQVAPADKSPDKVVLITQDSPTDTIISLLKFRLADTELANVAASSVMSATLKLFVRRGMTDPTGSVSAYLMKRPWANPVNWSKVGMATSADFIDPANNVVLPGGPSFTLAQPSEGEVIEQDVTDDVKAWLAGTEGNEGWAFVNDSTDDVRFVASNAVNNLRTNEFIPMLEVDLCQPGSSFWVD